MRKAETTLSIIRDRGRRGLPLERVYRLLFNPNFYQAAYEKIYRNDGAMTSRSHGRNRGRNVPGQDRGDYRRLASGTLSVAAS